MRRRTGAAIGADHTAKIEPVDHLDDKARQMSLRQPLVHRRRQKKRRLPITVPKIAHRQQATIGPNQWSDSSKNQRRWVLSPTGC
jgi:hypothetical protein